VAGTIGAIAGIGPNEPPADPLFAELATEFLDRIGTHGWSWCCAFGGSGRVSSWVEPYREVLRRYRTTAEGSTLPTIARIWGATYNGAAPIIVDQDNLRVWIVDDDACRELSDTDPTQRITRAVELLAV
jgi:hypothetical protein